MTDMACHTADDAAARYAPYYASQRAVRRTVVCARRLVRDRLGRRRGSELTA